jgi:hypothetical protein
MKKAVRLLAALALAAGALVATQVATTGSASAARVYCYQQPLERIAMTHRVDAVTWETDAIEVTPGSPCRDINLRSSLVGGRSSCVAYRVVFQALPQYGSRWTTVCGRWTVALYGATEGLIYHVQALGVPNASVIVRG